MARQIGQTAPTSPLQKTLLLGAVVLDQRHLLLAVPTHPYNFSTLFHIQIFLISVFSVSSVISVMNKSYKYDKIYA